MPGDPIDWPPIEGLVAYCKKYGVSEAARKLGVSRTSLSAHLDKHNIPLEDRKPEPRTLNEDALKELHGLID